MAKVIVSGASDDLIEVGGDIREEFNYLRNDQQKGAVLGFSDGTVLRILFDEQVDGIWRITPLVRGTASLTVDQAAADDDGGSDKATLQGDVSWVMHGLDYAASR